jgi:hypothetical protein
MLGQNQGGFRRGCSSWMLGYRVNDLLYCGTRSLQMVSKPSGGKVGTVNDRGKPATNRVLKQCLSELGLYVAFLVGVPSCWPGLLVSAVQGAEEAPTAETRLEKTADGGILLIHTAPGPDGEPIETRYEAKSIGELRQTQPEGYERLKAHLREERNRAKAQGVAAPQPPPVRMVTVVQINGRRKAEINRNGNAYSVEETPGKIRISKQANNGPGPAVELEVGSMAELKEKHPEDYRVLEQEGLTENSPADLPAADAKQPANGQGGVQPFQFQFRFRPLPGNAPAPALGGMPPQIVPDAQGANKNLPEEESRGLVRELAVDRAGERIEFREDGSGGIEVRVTPCGKLDQPATVIKFKNGTELKEQHPQWSRLYGELTGQEQAAAGPEKQVVEQEVSFAPVPEPVQVGPGLPEQLNERLQELKKLQVSLEKSEANLKKLVVDGKLPAASLNHITELLQKNQKVIRSIEERLGPR